ncbi:MAG: PHP domain-containing protein [Acidimicrobiales bacterium]
MIDLHTHSSCSDGTDPPGRIVELAAAAGCSAVALTDHDTLVGLDEAGRRAGELAVTLVPGCEVSCAYRGRNPHVLVYFVTDVEGPLQEELARLREDRKVRNARLVARLQSLGAPITYEEVVAEAAGEESVGRPHVAAVLVRHGLAESIPDAFDRLLGEGKPAYIPKARVSPAEIAALATASGGVPVLAHPFTLDLGPSGLAAAAAELAAVGFAGIEAYYARYTRDQRAALRDLAQRHDLVATGGTDYHGAVKAGLSVGVGEGDLSVPDHVLDDLEARRP